MNERTATVDRAILSALDSQNANDVVSGVKNAVATEIAALNPDATINFTTYFNHTYVPDMVLTWGTGSGRRERALFIRYDFSAEEILDESQSLREQDPVLMGVVRSDRGTTAEELRDSVVAESDRVLVTHIAAVADMNSVVDSQDSVERPILELVRSSLLSGGRGYIDSDDVSALATGATRDLSINEEPTSFDDLLGRVFRAETVLQVERSTSLIQWALGHTQSPLIAGGSLSEQELRTLIPFLLRDGRASDKYGFWSYVGQLMTFSDLEQLAPELQEVDLGPLVQANLWHWTAKRLQLSANPDYESSEPLQSPAWRMRGRNLQAISGPWWALLTSDSRHLKGRDVSGGAARWEDISGTMRQFQLDGIALHGLSRVIRLAAEEDGDVHADVETIRRSIDDEFLVTAASVRTSRDESSATVDLEFPAMLATARTEASIGDLTRLGFQLLGYRQTSSASEELWQGE